MRVIRLIGTLAALALLASAPCLFAAEANDWKIVPGVRVGPVHADTVRADLKNLFPNSTIDEQELELDEGLVFPSTVIAKGAQGESLSIVWNGKSADAHPKEVFVCRGRRRVACKYQVEIAGAQIAAGTRLSELEKLNGGPLTVNGFGWTYGGNILSWDNGRVSRIDCNKSLSIALDGERNRDGDLTANLTDAEKESFEGNRPITSTTPGLRKLDPTVTEILFIFPAAGARACGK